MAVGFLQHGACGGQITVTQIGESQFILLTAQALAIIHQTDRLDNFEIGSLQFFETVHRTLEANLIEQVGRGLPFAAADVIGEPHFETGHQAQVKMQIVEAPNFRVESAQRIEDIFLTMTTDMDATQHCQMARIGTARSDNDRATARSTWDGPGATPAPKASASSNTIAALG